MCAPAQESVPAAASKSRASMPLSRTGGPIPLSTQPHDPDGYHRRTGREDAHDDGFPIPVAASAHIHAAAVRAVGGGDESAPDFDVVEHYVSTRPTSGIRPRSGMRSTAVNPALAAVRAGASGRRAGEDDSGKMGDEDAPPPPSHGLYSRHAPAPAAAPTQAQAQAAVGQHSRRRHNPRAGSGLDTAGIMAEAGLPPVVSQIGPSLIGSFPPSIAAYGEAQAKLVADADDASRPPVSPH